MFGSLSYCRYFPAPQTSIRLKAFAEKVHADKRAQLLSDTISGLHGGEGGAEALRRRLQQARAGDTAATMAKKTASLERLRSMMGAELERMGTAHELLGVLCLVSGSGKWGAVLRRGATHQAQGIGVQARLGCS
jgi:hypothetical protein